MRSPSPLLPLPMVGAERMKIFDFDNPWSQEKALLGKGLHQIIYYIYLLKLLLKNVEEILFGCTFLGAHIAQTVSKHVWVCR